MGLLVSWPVLNGPLPARSWNAWGNIPHGPHVGAAMCSISTVRTAFADYMTTWWPRFRRRPMANVLGMPPNVASPTPTGAANVYEAAGTVEAMLAGVRLSAYTTAFTSEGYEY